MRDRERVQQRVTEMMNELQPIHLLWETPRRAGAIQPEGEKAQGRSVNVHKKLKVGCKKDGAAIFPVVPSTRTRGSWCKQEIPLAISKHFFVCPVSVTEHWHRLSREVMESASFEILKKLCGHSPGQPTELELDEQRVWNR